MKERQFRTFAPKRTYSGREYADYRRYKVFLTEDYNRRCGYTDCNDFWFGGTGNFQIDHFKPKSKYPELETKYSNLIYSCSYVNRAKSDDDGNYIDPCDVDYNEHFFRDVIGNIYPRENSDSAKHMYRSLKLYLKRYGIIWMLDQIEQRMFKLQELIEANENYEAKILLADITMKYNNYKRYLRAAQ